MNKKRTKLAKYEEIYLRPSFAPEEMTLYISCKDIKLCNAKANLTIDIPKEKIEQYDTIVINGIKFKKEN